MFTIVDEFIMSSQCVLGLTARLTLKDNDMI